MSAPDIASVLSRHMIGYERRCYPAYVCLCGWDGAQGDNGSETDGQHDNADSARAHVADAIRAELRAWLESEAERNRQEGERTQRMSLLDVADALAALAECVGVEEVGA